MSVVLVVLVACVLPDVSLVARAQHTPAKTTANNATAKTAKNATAAGGPASPAHTTQRGCKCKGVWATECGVGGVQQTVQFFGCGMETPCDGDTPTMDTAFDTWCFVEPNCTRARVAADSNGDGDGGGTTAQWDYCRFDNSTTAAPAPAPVTTPATAPTAAAATSAPPGNDGRTKMGCECDSSWQVDCTALRGPGHATAEFMGCNMLEPCDGDTGSGVWSSWCLVKPTPTNPDCGLVSPTGSRYDYCVPGEYAAGAATPPVVDPAGTAAPDPGTKGDDDPLANPFYDGIDVKQIGIYLGAFVFLVTLISAVLYRCEKYWEPDYDFDWGLGVVTVAPTRPVNRESRRVRTGYTNPTQANNAFEMQDSTRNSRHASSSHQRLKDFGDDSTLLEGESSM